MARNRNRQPGPIRRTIVAPPPTATVGTSPALRSPDRIAFTGPGPRHGHAKGGGQTSPDGRLSAWMMPADLPYSQTVTTHESRWSQTVNNRSI